MVFISYRPGYMRVRERLLQRSAVAEAIRLARVRGCADVDRPLDHPLGTASCASYVRPCAFRRLHWGQVGAPQYRPDQPGAAKVRTHQTHTVQGGLAELRLQEVKTGEVGLTVPFPAIRYGLAGFAALGVAGLGQVRGLGAADDAGAGAYISGRRQFALPS
jgi:hypothetical protein